MGTKFSVADIQSRSPPKRPGLRKCGAKGTDRPQDRPLVVEELRRVGMPFAGVARSIIREFFL